MRNRRTAFLAAMTSIVFLVGLANPATAGRHHRHSRQHTTPLTATDRHALASPNAHLQMYEAVVTDAQAQQIESGGYDIASEEQVQNGVDLTLVLYPWQRQRLQKQGIDLHLWRNTEGRTATQLAAEQTSAGFKVWRDFDGPDGFGQYMHDLAAANPDILKLEVVGTTYGNPSGTPALSGHAGPREIIALKLTANAGTETDGSRPAVLYSSNQHAREWISAEVNRRLLAWLIKMYREDRESIRSLLQTTELWFVLVANPDGYQYTFEYDRLWRKNLADNNGDGYITSIDGVDPNRNFPEHWNFDDEGSSTAMSSETYRGPSADSEPETQAMIEVFNRSQPEFQVNYHSFGELLLYTFGFQVNTPSADDPIFDALSGTDAKPAIDGFDPGVGADLYTTNGETTDYAHAVQHTLAWTPELGDGPHDDGFVFPDKEGNVENEFAKTLKFDLSVARSAVDPDDPDSSVNISTSPFYLDVSQIDPQKSYNPMSDFRFAYSYGDPQPVQVLAKRDLNGDGTPDAVTLNYSINGGATQTASTSEWNGGDRYGGPGDVYYHIMRGDVTGTSAGDSVNVWFTGGGQTSPSFTYQAVSETGNDVLVVAAEDYSGPSTNPPYPAGSTPHFLSYYTDALTANGLSYDVYDVDARGRTAPDHLGVLGHYDAVVWYTGNDLLTREPGQPPGTGASTLANSEMLQIRAYLNEGGRLLYTGRNAGWQFANAFDYNPISTPPYCNNADQTVDDGCLQLSDDFLQYWLGAYNFIEDGGTNSSTGEPYSFTGVAPPFDTATTDPWTLNGGDSANNHHPTATRGTTQSFLTTSSILKPADYPQFDSTAPAKWDTPGAGAFSPHSGSYYAYSDRGDISYRRLQTTIDVPSGTGNELSFWISYDTEPQWDFVFAEAHHPGSDDWVTLPDLNGHTSSDTGNSCPAGWFELHPFLARYEGSDCSGAGWNASTGRSAGWEHWRVNLDDWAGGQVELSISYASDWAVQGLGAWVDDIDGPGTGAGSGDTGFETGLDGWTVPGPQPGSAPNPNDWYRTTDVGFEEGAIVAMDPSDGSHFRTLYFGFGFEGVTSEAMRDELMGEAMGYLLAP